MFIYERSFFEVWFSSIFCITKSAIPSIVLIKIFPELGFRSHSEFAIEAMREKLTREIKKMVSFEKLKEGNLELNVRLSYAIMKNQNSFQDILKTFQEIRKSSKEYEEFEEKRKEICEELAEKNEDGTPIIEDGFYIIPEQDKADEKINELREEYIDAIEKQDKKNEEILEILEEEIEIEIYMISLNLLPETMLHQEVKTLYPILQE